MCKPLNHHCAFAIKFLKLLPVSSPHSQFATSPTRSNGEVLKGRVNVCKRAIQDGFIIDIGQILDAIENNPKTIGLPPGDMAGNQRPDGIVDFFKAVQVKERRHRGAEIYIIQIGADEDVILLVLPEDQATARFLAQFAT